MSEPNNPFQAQRGRGESSRAGFIADLAFMFGVAWLVLWRSELFSAAPGSIWTGGWPAVVLGGLLAAASGIGLAIRRPRGFLPLTLRWCCLTACLILPVWIAFAIVDARPSEGMDGAAAELRTGAEEMRAAATTPEQVREVEKVIETSEAVERLASALAAAKERGIEVPRKDLTALGFETSAVAELPAATRDTLEQAAGLVARQQDGLPPPPGFTDLMKEFGLDNPMIQQALIGLAAATLGPLLGVSPALVHAVLQALLIEGGLTPENVSEVAIALALSTTKAGNFSATLFKRNIKKVRQGAEAVSKIHDAFAKRGVSLDSRGMQMLREGAGGDQHVRLSPTCQQAMDAARRQPPATRPSIDTLRSSCGGLSIEEIAAGLEEGGR